GEGGRALAIEVPLKSVSHRFVEQDARPARPEDDGHGSRRGVDRSQFQERLPGGLEGKAVPALFIQEEVEGHAPTSPVGSDLALAVLLGDDRYVQAGERTNITHGPTRRG